MSKEDIMNTHPLNLFPKESWDECSTDELLKLLITIKLKQIRYGETEPIVISDDESEPIVISNDDDDEDETIIIISSDEDENDEGVVR